MGARPGFSSVLAGAAAVVLLLGLPAAGAVSAASSAGAIAPRVAPAPSVVPVSRAASSTSSTTSTRPLGAHKMPLIKSGIKNASAPAGAHLTYYGGRVMSNVAVENVFYGSGTYETGVATNMPTFWSAITNSAYMDWLSEYNTTQANVGNVTRTNQVIGRGTNIGSVTITPSAANNGATIDDTNMQAELAAQLTAGSVPAPQLDAAGNVNSIYALYFPAGKNLTQGGDAGGVVWCAYHGTLSWNGKHVPYMVLPDFADPAHTGYANGCGSNATLFNNFTSVASHELIEATTDPEVGLATVLGPPLAWYDNTNGEIGDICNAQQGSIAGWTVQTQFSNVVGDCVVTRPNTTPDFSISVAQPSQNVTSGSTVQYTVNTALTVGATQPINLSVSGLPSGVTGAFLPTSVSSGGSSTLTLTAAGGTPATPSTQFTVTGTGTISTHTANASVTVVAPTTVPGAPTGVSALPGNASATVSWTAPASNGGSSITGYVVTPYIGATAQPASTFNSTATSQLVSGLTNGTSYTFTVAAVNSVGTGAASSASSPVTPVTVPGPPTGVAAVAGNGSATVSWTAPASNGGSSITGYVVTPYIGATAQPASTFNSTATSQPVSGLTNGTGYTFTVAAVNSVGTGAASAASGAVTVGTPSAPGVASGTSLNASSKVTWTAPATANGSSITGYVVTPYLAGVAQAPQTFAGTATNHTVTGLTNGGSYQFTVAATNARGTGASSTLGPAILIGLPATPGFVSAASGNASAKVVWLAPSNNGSAITGYVVTPYIGAVAQAPQTFNTTATSVTVTGLTNATTYTFKVSAVNGVGTGPAGTSSAVIIGLPGSPGFFKTVSLDSSAKLTWVAPSGNGSPITSYVITPFVGTTALAPQTFNSASTTETVTGLTNGTTYTFQVVAVNVAGPGKFGTSPAVLVGLPGLPGFLSVASGNTTVKVAWTPAAGNGSPITGYVITPYIGTTAQAPQTFNSTATSETVTGLTNGQAYTFKVAAINAVGTGPTGTTASIVAGLPAAPGFLSVTSPAAGSAKLSWWPPSANGSPITGYVITPYLGSVAQAPQTFNSTANTRTLTGLTSGQTYKFKVQAINAAGTGPAGTTAAIVIT